MVRTTRAQRLALKKVFDREPLYRNGLDSKSFTTHRTERHPITYRQFRRAVFVGYDCIMVHWCGMWLGIEPDGYTHS